MPNDISKIMNCDSIDSKYATMLFLEYGYLFRFHHIHEMQQISIYFGDLKYAKYVLNK